MGASKFLECNQVVSGFLPVDLQTAANNGDYVNMENFNRCTFIFFKGAGTAGDDPTITLREAKDNAGTDVQDLVAIDTVYTKQDTALTAEATFTKNTQTAAATYTDTTSAEDAAIWIFEVRADEMSDGFTHLVANVGDVGGNAQLGCLLYVLHEPRYKEDIIDTAID